MKTRFAPARRRAAGVLAAALLLAFAARGARANANGYKIIVNSSTSISTMSRSELSAMFLKKRTTWPDGTPVTPVDLPENTEARAIFSREVLGKPPGAVQAYWNQMIFSGRATPPVTRGSEAEVVSYVRSNPGAVGYVGSSTSTPGVRVVTVQ